MSVPDLPALSDNPDPWIVRWFMRLMLLAIAVIVLAIVI